MKFVENCGASVEGGRFDLGDALECGDKFGWTLHMFLHHRHLQLSPLPPRRPRISSMSARGARSTPGPWSRLKPVNVDLLEVIGLPSKGDNR
jgi:hypothetical protein